MSKKDDLEKLIENSYNIVRQNDQQILTADPRSQLRLQQENNQNWIYIKTYLEEYTSLCEFRKLKALEDIIDISATRFPDIARRLENAPEGGRNNQIKQPMTTTMPSPATPIKEQNILSKFFSKEQAPQFEIKYKFLHPFASIHAESLVQFTLGLNSYNNTPIQHSDIVTHICLVLDVSGSMETPDKYPYLLQAIPYVIDALSDKDFLSIILFSNQSEIMWSDNITNTRINKQTIIDNINQSKIKFSSTNLSRGLEIAINKIKQFRQFQPKAVNRLYVLTDGQLTDEAECLTFNAELRRYEIEINAYGFGSDFAESTMRQVMDGCVGGRVKRVSNTDMLWQSFHHIGEVAQNIIATNAELELDFSPHITPGDAFRVDPGRHWFNSPNDQSKHFYTYLGALEKQRFYTYAFEARIYPSHQKHDRLAIATLRYLFHGEKQTIVQDIFIERATEQELYERVDSEIETIFFSLEELRSKDPASMMKSYQARIKILHDQGGDPVQIQLLEQAIRKLTLKGNLATFSEQEMIYLDADRNSTHVKKLRMTDTD